MDHIPVSPQNENQIVTVVTRSSREITRSNFGALVNNNNGWNNYRRLLMLSEISRSLFRIAPLSRIRTEEEQPVSNNTLVSTINLHICLCPNCTYLMSPYYWPYYWPYLRDRQYQQIENQARLTLQDTGINSSNVYIRDPYASNYRMFQNSDSFSNLYTETPTLENSFFFLKTETINFNLETDGFWSLFEKVKNNKSYKYKFNVINKNSEAFGNGATKQVYQKIIKEIIDLFTVTKNLYFIDFDSTNSFWQSEENMQAFVSILSMIVSEKCVLPYHLPPLFISILCKKTLNKMDLEFYMDKFDVEVFNKVKDLTESEFNYLCTDYETVLDLYKSTVLSANNQTIDLYNRLCNYFGLFVNFEEAEILELDNKFSGLYEITANVVLSMTIFTNPNVTYFQMWKEFLDSLTKTELKNMITLFGNSLCTTCKYTIDVEPSINVDIHISVCFSKVTINEKLFSENLLNNLKIYFAVETDSISDIDTQMYNFNTTQTSTNDFTISNDSNQSEDSPTTYSIERIFRNSTSVEVCRNRHHTDGHSGNIFVNPGSAYNVHFDGDFDADEPAEPQRFFSSIYPNSMLVMQNILNNIRHACNTPEFLDAQSRGMEAMLRIVTTDPTLQYGNIVVHPINPDSYPTVQKEILDVLNFAENAEEKLHIIDSNLFIGYGQPLRIIFEDTCDFKFLPIECYTNNDFDKLRQMYPSQSVRKACWFYLQKKTHIQTERFNHLSFDEQLFMLIFCAISKAHYPNQPYSWSTAKIIKYLNKHFRKNKKKILNLNNIVFGENLKNKLITKSKSGSIFAPNSKFQTKKSTAVKELASLVTVSRVFYSARF